MVDSGSDDGSLADLAYDAIRQAILRCDLAPGQYVTEAQLSTQFGAGRAAVRAAQHLDTHDLLGPCVVGDVQPGLHLNHGSHLN